MKTRSTWVILFLMLGAPAILAGSAEDWSFATEVGARLRYEVVDDDAVEKRANALTLRSRVGFSATRTNFGTAFFEFEDVSAVGSDRYNSSANGMGDFAVVLDGEATELNRAWISHKTDSEVAFKLGRQRIVRDRGRFIGDVAWRQNHQTIDALTVARNSGKFNFFAAYLNRVNRIFGDQHPNPLNREFEMNSWAGEVEVPFEPGSITGIVHFLEFRNNPIQSHQNAGLRWLGKHELDGEGRRLEYRAEWIDQESFADGANMIDATYLAAELGYETKRWGVGANLEQLGGDGSYGFQRPLATLHAYNGWADRFVNTPAQGLNDLFIDGRVAIKKCTLLAQIHRFDSDQGSLHYGDELGLALVRKLRDRWKMLFKYAIHSADDVGMDVQKLWLSIEFSERFEHTRG
jgi:hypothetical protein